MNKKELRKQLEEVYFRCLFNQTLGTDCYWTELGADDCVTKSPWKKALARYKEFSESPLAKIMQEED